jgi:ABC-type glycerol-3-phosphate transport system substrate-binding protein
MSSTRRWVIGQAALALGGGGAVAALASACSSAAQQAPASGTPVRQPVTLRLDYRTEQWIADRAKAFTEANPTITVDLVADTGYEKLLVLAAAGDLGDVWWASTGQGSYFELVQRGMSA